MTDLKRGCKVERKLCSQIVKISFKNLEISLKIYTFAT